MSGRWGARMRGATVALAAAAVAGTAPAAAQQEGATCQPRDDRPQRSGAGQPAQEHQAYDVIVDVPDLCVERITLEVDGLDAQLELHARVANLVQVHAGADVAIRTVQLGIYGVRAEALLLVDLDNVAYIVNRTLTFLDRSPQVVTRLMGTVQNAVGTVGEIGGQALGPGGAVTELVGTVGRTLEQVTRPGGILTRTVDQTGRTVVRALGEAGSIVEHTLDTAGRVAGSRQVGRLLDLPVLQETSGAAGGVVRRVEDASGALIEYTLSSAGRVTDARIVRPAGG